MIFSEGYDAEEEDGRKAKNYLQKQKEKQKCGNFVRTKKLDFDSVNIIENEEKKNKRKRQKVNDEDF